MMDIMNIVLAFIFISGLCIGSFLNVVILRTVSEESIVFPGSKCPKCQTPLKWYHNIPVLSYIFLRGKCAFCGEKISVQYPLVELFTGVIYAILGYLYLCNTHDHSPSIYILALMLVMSLIVVSFLIVISGTDIKEMKVSDKHTYSLIAAGPIYSVIIGLIVLCVDLKFGSINFWSVIKPLLCTVFAVIVAFVFMEVLRRLLNYLLRTESFGDGDSYIFAGIAGSLAALSGITDLKFISVNLLAMFLSSVLIAVLLSLPFYIIKLIKNKNWTLLSALISFFVYSPIYFSLGYSGLYDNTAILILCTLILVIIGITLCILIVRGIAENKENIMMIPFGPALCFSCLIVLLAMPYILGID